MSGSLLNRLQGYRVRDIAPKPPVAGKLTRVVGLTLEAIGCRAAIGALCRIDTQDGSLEAEVVGFSGDRLFLMPSEQLKGVIPGARVVPITEEHGIPVGMNLLGGSSTASASRWTGSVLSSLPRRCSLPSTASTRSPAARSINRWTWGARHQRRADGGAGPADGAVRRLRRRQIRAARHDDPWLGGRRGGGGAHRRTGPRGEGVHRGDPGEEGRARSVVVAAPADASPLMRLKGCETALAIAEYFRDQGLNVLLLMDSLTRYAQAQREIALAVGEPPATKGYPPSVFAKLPALVERAGNGSDGQGSITAFFTVLTEGDDLQDPIADAARAILDGHIVLSRELADAGHYPAIDIEKSISRVMPMVTSPEHMELARTLKQFYSLYQQNRDLITIGAYSQGSDPRIDRAIIQKPYLDQFLQQGMREVIHYDAGLQALQLVAMPLMR